MITFLLLLILLFIVGKSLIGMAASVAGALIGLIVILIIYAKKRRR